MFIFDFAPPKRMGLRSHMRLSGVLVKSILEKRKEEHLKI